jgi:hypothetical protein
MGASPEGDRAGQASLRVMPITLREANDFVEQFHRHSRRTARDGGKFAIAASDGAGMWGVAIVGNPLSATLMDGFTSEVLRVCTRDGAPKNTCSFLYGRCWRIWQQMGGRRLVTYTLQTESGASLKGAGWKIAGETRPHDRWSSKNDQAQREWQPIYGQAKFRWEVSAARREPTAETGTGSVHDGPVPQADAQTLPKDHP